MDGSIKLEALLVWSILCGEEGFGALEVSLDHAVKVGHLVHLASAQETRTVYQSDHRDRERGDMA